MAAALPLLLLWPLDATAAVAVDQVTEHNTGRNVASFSFNHTVGAGPDRLLLVSVIDGYRNTFVRSITYGGANLTRVERLQGYLVASEVWMLVAPSMGTRPVVVTMNDSSDQPMAAAISYTGVDQAAPVGPASTMSGMGRNVAVSVATSPGDLTIDAASAWGAQSAGVVPGATAGAAQLSRWSFGNNGDYRVMGSEKVATGTATTMGWTTSITSYWVTVAMTVKATQAPPPPPDAAPPPPDAAPPPPDAAPPPPPDAAPPPPPDAAPPPADATAEISDAATAPDAGSAPDAQAREDAGAGTTADVPASGAIAVDLAIGSACSIALPIGEASPGPSALAVLGAATLAAALRARRRRRRSVSAAATAITRSDSDPSPAPIATVQPPASGVLGEPGPRGCGPVEQLKSAVVSSPVTLIAWIR